MYKTMLVCGQCLQTTSHPKHVSVARDRTSFSQTSFLTWTSRLLNILRLSVFTLVHNRSHSISVTNKLVQTWTFLSVHPVQYSLNMKFNPSTALHFICNWKYTICRSISPAIWKSNTCGVENHSLITHLTVKLTKQNWTANHLTKMLVDR